MERLLPRLARTAVRAGRAPDGKVHLTVLHLDCVEEKNRTFNSSETSPQWKHGCVPLFNTGWSTISRRWVWNEVSLLGLLGLLFAFTLWALELLSVLLRTRCWNCQAVISKNPTVLFTHTSFVTFNKSWIQIYFSSKSKLIWVVKHWHSSCCG